VTWMPVYYIRYHDMSTGEAGTVISLMVGVLGGLGAFGGGAICARLSHRDIRWNCWVPALAIGMAIPLYFAMLATDNTKLAILIFIIPGFLSSVYAGPTWSIIQELVPSNKRAVAASIFMMIFNLVGLGLGPLAVGILSDLYMPSLGDESLRWGMITVLLIGIGGIFFYLRAASSITTDLKRLQH
jgi:MFS family permease